MNENKNNITNVNVMYSLGVQAYAEDTSTATAVYDLGLFNYGDSKTYSGQQATDILLY